MNLNTAPLLSREEAIRWREEQRAQGRRVVTTNGCFDILHAGHIELLQRAKALGDTLLVGLNADDSVRRLKGSTRPIHGQEARAAVLNALKPVDAVTVFEESTPVELLRALRPDIHVKGGDYDAEKLPETPIVRAAGGRVVIVPLLEGFSTTRAIRQFSIAQPRPPIAIIPARYGSTRFPGKPLAELEGQTVIERVVRQVLQSSVARPVFVATDDERIAEAVMRTFSPAEAEVVMTSVECRTGTDRLAEVVQARIAPHALVHTVVLNVQGDEPFVQASHLDALLRLMEDETLRMGTITTPVRDEAMQRDPNVVKVVCDSRGRALYFSRASIPLQRESNEPQHAPMLRHLGLYAYRADWLLEMAGLPSSPLEETEKLEQLRALEAGVDIGVVTVESTVDIAIDTPQDLERAKEYLKHRDV